MLELSVAGAFIRVSTSEQNPNNQRRELLAVAERHGWTVLSVFEDAGISGAKGRDQRPGLDALMKAVARREIDMVAAWSVDRLGRSLTDLLNLLKELHAKSVDLFCISKALTPPHHQAGQCFRCSGCLRSSSER
jgi:DNA invertase Pin-like site-specific DNA recombinase